ncbi:MAG: hypothetical protein CMJ81_11750 [Planctomycetaceae bacterium]|nr:hypothetical protein [Planctomycetaceae bacterium]MBP63973.1 hypothetical protein [Planctomycetaceae bacterium]
MQPAKLLREKLAGHELVSGMIVTDHLWPQLVEIAVESGLDYLIIDTEHLTHPATLVAEVCALGRLTNFPVLLRPPSSGEMDIRAAMDVGPCGLLLPCIESAEHLNRVREAVYMPPRGSRRPGGPGNRWVSHTGVDYELFRSHVEDHLIIIPQVETMEALSCAQEIAQHELTTALGIGPYDLSAQLGICWKGLDHPTMKQSLEQLRAAAQSADKPFWMIGAGEVLVEKGFRFICMGEATGLFQLALRTQVNRLKELHT